MESKNPQQLVMFLSWLKIFCFPQFRLRCATLVTNFTARLFEFYFAIMLNLKSINILLKLICSGDRKLFYNKSML